MQNVSEADQIIRAIERCSEEPITIPGCIQSFGCVVAVDQDTGEVRYASENSATVFARPIEAVLNGNLQTLFGEEVRHSIRNALSRGGHGKNAVFAGTFSVQDRCWDLSICSSGGCLVISMEPSDRDQTDHGRMLQSMSFMIGKIQSCRTDQNLYDLIVQLVRHLTGFDRVLVYRFDQEFNGEVLAETCRSGMPSFNGLRFPRYDIPDQAREMMLHIPLRVSADTSAAQIPLLTAQPGLPPLDLTHSVCRGMSPVHLQYLRNMGSAATLTLNVLVEGKLWGVISCHHGTPRYCGRFLHEILENIIPVFSAKLLSIRQQDTLDRIKQLDSEIMGRAIDELQLDGMMTEIAPSVLEVMGADGIATLGAEKSTCFGLVPGKALLDELRKSGLAEQGGVLAIDNLVQRFPDLQAAAGDCAGALVTLLSSDRVLCIFRREVVQEVSWAGNPEKQTEVHEGERRLTPRASFSAFLEAVQGNSRAWSGDDVYFIQHVRTLMHASERQSLMNRMNRQQSLMIDELNHRVRNILALVRSVSHQARRRYSSLESYSTALESRIQALAASHELIAGTLPQPVSLMSLIRKELQPYNTSSDGRFVITGTDRNVLAEIAPIFSLVVHELITNAVKYGGMSTAGGCVEMGLSRDGGDTLITWAEKGGPPVNTDPEAGFGTTMITRSVPYELGGESELFFYPEGVQAKFRFPERCFDDSSTPARLNEGLPLTPAVSVEIPEDALEGSVLVVEDNFIIGTEMCDQLLDFGFADAQVYANASEAMDYLDAVTPGLAVLDFNLGHGETSEAVAVRLREAGVPVVFVTGYGEKAATAPELADVPRLTKPVSTDQLRHELARVLQ